MRFCWLVLIVACACGAPPIRLGTTAERAIPAAEGPDRVRIRRLVVAYAEAEGASGQITRTRDEARERADMLAGMARDTDQSFQELVSAYGDAPPDRDDRQLERLLVRGEEPVLSDEEQAAAFALDEGQVSAPIERPFGFVILRRSPDPRDGQGGPENIRARHILISFRGARSAGEGVGRTREEARALALQIAHSARDSANDWVALHREYSNEEGSPAGGDLGLFGRGQMVPEFERAAWALEVNEISDPIESPFGFHIIQRTE